jgi:hypothetical protein
VVWPIPEIVSAEFNGGTISIIVNMKMQTSKLSQSEGAYVERPKRKL